MSYEMIIHCDRCKKICPNNHAPGEYRDLCGECKKQYDIIDGKHMVEWNEFWGRKNEKENEYEVYANTNTAT